MQFKHRCASILSITLAVINMHPLAVFAQNQKSDPAGSSKAPVGTQKKGNPSGKGAARPKQKLTEAEALKKVSNLPEVKAWKLSVQKASTKQRPLQTHIELDRKEGDSFVIHVYEEVPDDAETSHTATMNWYYVNFRTGAIRKEQL